MKKSTTVFAINESTRFDIPGDTWSWTGEGKIYEDDYDNQYRWFSRAVARDWGRALTGLEDIQLTIRLRGEQTGETLIATHPGGSEELHNITPGKPALYRFYLRSTVTGDVSVRLNFKSNRIMVIDTINVIGPVSPWRRIFGRFFRLLNSHKA
ncbi:hypothetical protein [Pseudomonas fluorescens]|uniref:hypothetical protein n=1 Tax=Pseudomonas fluorescens TaxID=294 RepID=UPI0005C54B4F|nr:hypothetical protein [Pseudomonas fluorescens]